MYARGFIIGLCLQAYAPHTYGVYACAGESEPERRLAVFKHFLIFPTM